MAEKEILYSVKDNVATITINRPKVLNAFTGENIKASLEFRVGNLVSL